MKTHKKTHFYGFPYINIYLRSGKKLYKKNEFKTGQIKLFS